jgi:Kef-type K+ transport system membrane component KefB
MIVAQALSTTALGTIIPSLHDSGSLNTRLGTHVLAAGSIGEFGPILATSLLLTRKFDVRLQLTVLVGFAALAVTCALIAVEVENPGNPALAHAGNAIERPIARVPVAVDRQLVWSDCGEGWLRSRCRVFFPPEWSFFGLATSGGGEELKLFREKTEAISFAVFVPFFFVMSGMKLDVHALFTAPGHSCSFRCFLRCLLWCEGVTVPLYLSELRKGERLPFARYSATELPMVVAISEIALRLNIMRTEIATALIGAGVRSVLLFPAIADATLPPRVQSETASATD